MAVQIDFLPAGTYYVGDLCYVLTVDQWAEVCALELDAQGCYELSDGVKIAIVPTLYGDGEYSTNIPGVSIGVDSGTIGCVEISDIDINRLSNLSVGSFTVEVIDGKFIPRVGFDGTFVRFGTVEVFFESDEDEDEVI